MNTITKKEFIEIWKKISNDQRIKPKLVEYGSGNYKYTSKEKGWIYPEHHILYNLVRGYPASRGFTIDTIGYENALSFFKDTPSTYVSNLIFKPFKEQLKNEQFFNLLTKVKENFNN